MSPWSQAIFLLAAGVVGGTATSAGAIATLISYPALLAVGLPAMTANVTNAVAVVGTGISSGLASRPELAGTRARLVRSAVLAVVGALAGAGMLLSTPPGLFVWVVPFLVAGSAVLLLAQPRIVASRRHLLKEDHEALWSAGLVAVGVYNGYFGAGSGIMLLALVMITIESGLIRANALKNVLLGVADLVAAMAFIAFGPVDWPAALALGAGFLVGGSIGPSLARRAPAEALRRFVAIAGLLLAAGLFVAAARAGRS